MITVRKYDEKIMQSDEGRMIYSRWASLMSRNREVCSKEFQDFTMFYEWAISAGFTYFSMIRRKDKTLPYSPENCYWDDYSGGLHGFTLSERKEFAEKWNKTVNRIRKHYGMSPLPGTEQAKTTEGDNEDGDQERQ